MTQQSQITFFDEDSPPPKSSRQWRGDFDNPNCAFRKWTGDMKKIQPLVDAAKPALDKFNHHCTQSFATLGTTARGSSVVPWVLSFAQERLSLGSKQQTGFCERNHSNRRPEYIARARRCSQPTHPQISRFSLGEFDIS
jgi:hypothetical protein